MRTTTAENDIKKLNKKLYKKLKADIKSRIKIKKRIKRLISENNNSLIYFTTKNSNSGSCMHFCYGSLGRSSNMDVATAKEIFESRKYGTSLLDVLSRNLTSPYSISVKEDAIDYQIEIYF